MRGSWQIGQCGCGAPERSSTPAPCPLPSVIRAAVIVTGRPMSTSRPVPGYRFPKWALVYQSVCHAVAGLASIARRARSPLSPWPAPEAPNAAALAIRWEVTWLGGGLFPVLDADIMLAPAG